MTITLGLGLEHFVAVIALEATKDRARLLMHCEGAGLRKDARHVGDRVNAHAHKLGLGRRR